MISPERAEGARRGKRLKIVFVRRPFFPLHSVPWAKAERGDGVWGRLNIKKIRDDRYLYLST